MLPDFEKVYIDGQWRKPQSQETIALRNPATLEDFARVPDCNAADVEDAIAAADRAYASWSQTPIAGRIALMRKMLEYFMEWADDIVELETKELGAPVSFSRYSHCNRQFERVRHYIAAAEKVQLEIPYPLYTLVREPLGVVACITPWNYPLGQIVQKIIPAVLMGNTVVLKPASNTPLTAYLLIDAFDRAGFPAGVVNLITGRGSRMGRILSTDPRVAMISFTGSTSVGKEIARMAADGVKKAVLELGGKSPYIWLESADYRPAVKKLVASIFLNSGQTCTALSRLIVPEKELDRIKPLLVEAARSLRVGDPLDPDVDLGPVANRAQFDTVKSYLELGLEEGAELLCGRVPDGCEKGYFIEPAVFTGVKNSMRIAQEEIFGPVLCVLTYRTVDEAVAIANDTLYGLNAAVYGDDRELALAVARRIQSGGVYVNEAPRDESAPFGGYKQSGHGREGGWAGLEEFSQLKTIYDK